jgi:DNA polymerase-4
MIARTPRILLADCDQMFVAVARLVDPSGAGQAPLLVVGGSATSRGVVCSASYEVRGFGVRSGMPIARAVRLCPQATFVPVPREACGAKSREVAAVLRDWSPTVEAASIDEFYLDLTGTEALYKGDPLEHTAAGIRAAVMERVGLAVSIGGGTNRLVAKLAAERAKPRPGTAGTGVLIVPPGEEGAFLATHRLAEIPGVGPRLTAKLKSFGLESVSDALRLDRRDLEGWLGDRGGTWLYDRIRGRAAAQVEPRGTAKSMSHEETFPRDLGRDEDLELELLRLTTRLCAELRVERLAARCVTIKLRDSDFRTRQTSRTLAIAVDTDRAVLAVGRELLASLRARRRVPARLIGIALTRFEPATGVAQLSILDRPDPAVSQADRDRAVARAVDRINARFGRSAVRPARLAVERHPGRPT